ncbi:MAG: zf-TFIIB domain-containing protein [Planctomycetaceae bacterium]|nr:zf-TFIIB domain-containing protein [Planctomycetaceae bacterium]
MVAENRHFRCHQCGGSAVPVSGREYLQCEYCRTFVFTTDNPLSADRITSRNASFNVSCPACDGILQQGQVEEHPALYCGTCYGVLLKNEHFGEIIRQRRARRINCEAEACRPLNPQDYDRSIRCPNCAGHMEAHPYYGPGNVVMDSCHKCHLIWLDHGELRTLERAEGGREPELLPVFINSDGEPTFIPPPDQPRRAADPMSEPESPVAMLARAIFG